MKISERLIHTMKEKVDVTGVPETMLQTLYARAKETKKSEMSWPVETVSGKMFYLDGSKSGIYPFS